MPFLLRVELPDVPGSLGRVASTIGEAGGDIEAIEIVEKTGHGTAVDDVLLELAPGMMPDSIVSACSSLPGVHVLWVSRYAGGGNLFLDLEAVEDLTEHPGEAHQRLLALMPLTFRLDWAVRATQDGLGARILERTEAAPESVEWVDIGVPSRLISADDNLVLCGVPVGDDVYLLARRGGPEFLDSELARMGHLVGLATSIAQVQALTQAQAGVLGEAGLPQSPDLPPSASLNPLSPPPPGAGG
ncbi:ACT domain-containing protein [Nocardioides sp. 616]|uniref:ACT domain-containing protein n=1 Tax=Nocardioides sp. 616 TaxID=2268090 RepID=UPI00196415B7|nr:ACT domain-containing protein [Nocardioides sp. 616]